MKRFIWNLVSEDLFGGVPLSMLTHVRLAFVEAWLGNFTRRKSKLRFCIFCGFLEIFENFTVFRKSPQNLWIVFQQRSESPQFSARLAQKTRRNNSKKNARKISHSSPLLARGAQGFSVQRAPKPLRRRQGSELPPNLNSEQGSEWCETPPLV